MGQPARSQTVDKIPGTGTVTAHAPAIDTRARGGQIWKDPGWIWIIQRKPTVLYSTVHFCTDRSTSC